MTKTELLFQAKSLPKNDRIDLALELWDSIQIEASDFPLADDLKTELERRVAADLADQTPAEEWPSLRAKLLRGEF